MKYKITGKISKMYHIFRDAMILPFVDAFTSIFAGCVIFSTLGYTAAASNLDIDMVVK